MQSRCLSHQLLINSLFFPHEVFFPTWVLSLGEFISTQVLPMRVFPHEFFPRRVCFHASFSHTSFPRANFSQAMVGPQKFISMGDFHHMSFPMQVYFHMSLPTHKFFPHVSLFPCKFVSTQLFSMQITSMWVVSSHEFFPTRWFPREFFPMWDYFHASYFLMQVFPLESSSHVRLFPCEFMSMWDYFHVSFSSCFSHARLFPCGFFPTQVYVHMSFSPRERFPREIISTWAFPCTCLFPHEFFPDASNPFTYNLILPSPACSTWWIRSTSWCCTYCPTLGLQL